MAHNPCRLALALVALAAPAAVAATDLVAPEAFEALVEGRTLHFTLDGAPFGAEQFFPGRRSLWRFADGSCEPGRWEARGPEICFTYAAAPTPICWLFRRDGERFAAHLVEDGDETSFSLELDRVTADPLPCLGPPVGS